MPAISPRPDFSSLLRDPYSSSIARAPTSSMPGSPAVLTRSTSELDPGSRTLSHIIRRVLRKKSLDESNSCVYLQALNEQNVRTLEDLFAAKPDKWTMIAAQIPSFITSELQAEVARLKDAALVVFPPSASASSILTKTPTPAGRLPSEQQ